MDPLHCRLVECFTAETSANNPLDDTTTATSLSSILTTLASSPTTLGQLEESTTPLPTTHHLHTLLTAIPPPTYQRLAQVLSAILQAPEPLQAATWAVLEGEDVSCRPLLALMGVQLQRLSTRALLLGTCYVLLLALPSPPVFLANQRILRRILVLLHSWAQQKQQLTLQHKTNKRTKHSKGKKAAEAEDMELDDDDAEEAAQEEAGVQEEVEQLMGEAGETLIVQLLQAMQRLLSQWSLLPMTDVQPTLIDALVAVTRTQTEGTPHTLVLARLLIAACARTC